MPLTTNPEEIAALVQMAQELANEWGEPALVINEEVKTFDWSFPNRLPYATLLSEASPLEIQVAMARLEPDKKNA